MNTFNPQIPMRYGIIAAAVTLVMGMLMYVFYQAMFSNFILAGVVGFISLAITLFLGIWSGVSYRNDNGNAINFAQAFGAIYIVFVFTSLASIASSALVNKVIDPEYPTKASSILREKVEAQMEKANMTDEQIKEATKGLSPEKFDPSPAAMLKNLAISLAIMAAVAALAALFIRRGSSDLIVSQPIDDPSKT